MDDTSGSRNNKFVFSSKDFSNNFRLKSFYLLSSHFTSFRGNLASTIDIAGYNGGYTVRIIMVL
jgi:hypothetical protein